MRLLKQRSAVRESQLLALLCIQQLTPNLRHLALQHLKRNQEFRLSCSNTHEIHLNRQSQALRPRRQVHGRISLRQLPNLRPHLLPHQRPSLRDWPQRIKHLLPIKAAAHEQPTHRQ